MSEENKRIVRRFVEEQTSLEGVERVAEELLADGFVGHEPTCPDGHGPEGYKRFMEGTFRAYPDARFEVEDVIAEGDMVVRYAMLGTHEGTTTTGVAATGKEVEAKMISIFELSDGKIVEKWTNADFLGLMQQIGALPSPEQQQPSETVSSGQEPTY